jgi:hypothetical protein
MDNLIRKTVGSFFPSSKPNPPSSSGPCRLSNFLKNVGFLIFSVVGLLLLVRWVLPRDRVDQPVTTATLREQNAGDLQTVVRQVDDEFREFWREANLEPAPEADSLTVIRRLSLGLTGTIPSLEEIRKLDKVQDAERLEWWLGYLLQDQRYADYFAERLARAYVGTENGPFLVYRRRRFVHWLSDQVADNRPYNELVEQLITDEGLWTDSPAVNFVSVTADQNMDNKPDPIRLAARTSRAFLGLRVDCLQCHDDNLGTLNLGPQYAPRGGTQRDFHQLAAFFSEVESSLRGIQESEDPVDYVYKYLDSDSETVVPVSVPYREDLLMTDGTRRERLAAWITHPENRPFARAIVNRVWALLLGRPLVEPVDDLPLHGPFPPGLERLADDLIAHQYDLKRLIAIIASTAAFRRDSRAEFDITSAHEESWAVFPVTRLRPEQIAGAAIQASSLRTINAKASGLERLIRFGQEQDFVNRYGDLGEDEFNMTGGTIPQRLIMMNGELIAERTEPNDLLLNAPAQIATLSPDDSTAVETAYLVVLSRYPTPREQEHFENRLRESSGEDRRDRLSDLYWVLVNSSEFIWNH